jgi:hypothetical protein
VNHGSCCCPGNPWSSHYCPRCLATRTRHAEVSSSTARASPAQCQQPSVAPSWSTARAQLHTCSLPTGSCSQVAPSAPQLHTGSGPTRRAPLLARFPATSSSADASGRHGCVGASGRRPWTIRTLPGVMLNSRRLRSQRPTGAGRPHQAGTPPDVCGGPVPVRSAKQGPHGRPGPIAAIVAPSARGSVAWSNDTTSTMTRLLQPRTKGPPGFSWWAPVTALSGSCCLASLTQAQVVPVRAGRHLVPAGLGESCPGHSPTRERDLEGWFHRRRSADTAR